MNISKKVCMITNGCPENRIDGARMQEFLKQNGWIVTSDWRDADIILFNACALTKDSQENSMEIINRIKARKKPAAELIVYGCLPKINKERLREIYQGPTFGSDEVEQLNEIFEPRLKIQDIHANFLLPSMSVFHLNHWNVARRLRKTASPLAMAYKLLNIIYKRTISRAINVYNPNTFCIKVSTGCLNACSYCGIRFSRGRVKSKPIDNAVREFEEGLEKDYNEFGLIGTDVGAYGKDQGADLVTLLKELLKNKGDYKIKLRNIQPRFLIQMMPELREIFQTGKISYLGSAAESGNNRILSLMNRGYNIEDFKEAIRILNKEFPEIQICTQLMVGFPSETEEEFQDTVRLLDEVSFDVVEIYRFQPRPRTKAAKMKGQIPQKVIRRRYQKLLVKSVFNKIRRKKKALKEA